MKNIIFFVVVFCGVTLISCSDDNSINPIDLELQKNIIGTWQDDSDYRITFFTNGSFVDSIYFDPALDSSIIVRKGKYNINNSVLTLSEFYFDTIVTQSHIGFAILERAYEITIQNAILKRKSFLAFKNIGQNRMEIWDKWETTTWYAQIDAVDSSQTFYGSFNIEYLFIQDSNKCLQTNRLHNAVNDSIYEYSGNPNFTYNPPYLDISSDKDILVVFKSYKMYWYYYYVPKDLIKIR